MADAPVKVTATAQMGTSLLHEPTGLVLGVKPHDKKSSPGPILLARPPHPESSVLPCHIISLMLVTRTMGRVV